MRSNGSNREIKLTHPAIFMHIQKTAGSSIVEHAHKEYGSENVISHAQFMDYKRIEDLNEKRFISGHFGYNFASHFLNDRFSFTFLRDPLERILSFYYFCRIRDPQEYEIYRLSQELTLDQFLIQGFDNSLIKEHIWNHQATQLAYGWDGSDNDNVLSYDSSQILELAIQHLSNFSYIGFTETFSSDCKDIFRALGFAAPSQIIASNTNKSRLKAENLPASTLSILHDLTELDREVYETAWRKIKSDHAKKSLITKGADLNLRQKSEDISPRLIAFFLTQFHPTPENDLWWGKGFTEWTNVTKAKPLFEGHNQPHLPSDLGFYDLRLRETRREQIHLAKQYGIDGFCYHYYWFSGKRILNLPLDDMLQDSGSEMPFCLCWANENWTRRWDGAEQEVLMAQKYLPDDDLNFIKSLIPFFEDKRYIRVDGCLYLIVYFPQHLTDAKKTLKVWRDYCRSIGLGELHICAALTHGNENYTKYGFDSGVEFPPHNLKTPNCTNQIKFYEPHKGWVFQYAQIAEFYYRRRYSGRRIFKTVFPSWDNTARTKERALIVLNGHPENYEYWLSSTIDLAKMNQDGEQLVFINAWNEWAEGCHLEPDRWFGRGFLEATLNAKNGIRRFSGFTEVGLPHEESLAHRTFLKDLFAVLLYHSNLKIGDIKRAIHKRPFLYKGLFPIVSLARKICSKLVRLID